jgi:hypothetical protein
MTLKEWVLAEMDQARAARREALHAADLAEARYGALEEVSEHLPAGQIEIQAAGKTPAKE